MCTGCPSVPGRQLSHRAITFHHYLQYSVHWVFWYLGVPAVLLAALGAAVLARRCLRVRRRPGPCRSITFSWIIVTVLYRPAIVPHQPWASRRLVPGVLPGLILLSVWANGLAHRLGPPPRLRSGGHRSRPPPRRGPGVPRPR